MLGGRNISLFRPPFVRDVAYALFNQLAIYTGGVFMLVHPKQLKTGCLLLSDVMGKTIHPIVPKETVIQPIHIKVLNQFQIKEVDVAPKLATGEVFDPNAVSEEQENDTIGKMQHFLTLYNDCIDKTKKLFDRLRNRVPLNIFEIREYLLPLLKESEHMPEIIFQLHRYVKVEDYPFHQSIDIAIVSEIIAKKMNFSQGDQIQIALAAYLSNCGLANIEEDVIFKKGAFTEDEYNEIKKHPIHSYRMIESISMLKYEAKIAVLQHHERLDGSGYPFGLKANKIHQYSKIIAVSEAFIAMTSDRTYREKRSHYQVLEELLTDSFGKLDMEVIHTLARSLSSFSVGTKVKLSNGNIGEIVYVDEKNLTRPIVRLSENDSIIVLKDNKEVYIEQILYGVD